MSPQQQQAASIVWIEDEAASNDRLGGKLGSLAEMTSAGFDVPAAFGVTTDGFERFVEHTGLVATAKEVCGSLDVGDLHAVEAAAARMAEVIATAEMPPALEAEIRDAYAELCRRAGEEDVPVAVRSSGVSEDLEGASFAGQYDTYLWIQGADAVLENVRRCWSGLFGAQVLTYRPVDGVPPIVAGEIPGMCVGVQRMVASRTAGVMFTLDPITGDRSKIVIEGCWGLGEGVVKGDVTPDRFKVDKVTLEILDRDVSTQAEEYRFDEATGAVEMRPVEEERGARTCLSDEEIVALATLAKRVERHRGAPQDLEWAVDAHGAVHLLQARPETVWSAKKAQPKGTQGQAPAKAVDRVLMKFMTAGGAQR